MYNSESFKD